MITSGTLMLMLVVMNPRIIVTPSAGLSSTEALLAHCFGFMASGLTFLVQSLAPRRAVA